MSREMAEGSSAEITWDAHIEWFESALLDPNSTILIGEDDAGKIGSVRFEFSDRKTQAEVSINLNPARRRQGMSSVLLNKALQSAVPVECKKLTARVKHENIASKRCFLKCGFTQVHSNREFVNMSKITQSIRPRQ